MLKMKGVYTGKLYSFSQLVNYAIAKYGGKSFVCKNDPLQVCLFVTDRCTLSCKWCLRQTTASEYYSENFVENRHDITLEKAMEILQYFPKAVHVNFAGFGEPLLVNDLFKINAELKKRPMKTSVITNGTLLLDRMNDILNADFNYVSVSINSIDSNNFESTCGSSEKIFNNVLDGIQRLAKERKSNSPRLHISFVLTRDLFDQTPEIIKLAEELNVDSLDLHNMIPHKNYKDYSGILTTDDEEVVAKIAEWKSEERNVSINWPILIQKGLEKPAKICSQLWNWIGIDVEGNTAGCHKAMGTSGIYGNLFQEGKNVWNNEFRKKLRMSFLKGSKFDLDCCRTCTVTQP